MADKATNGMGSSGSSSPAILDLYLPKYLFPRDEGRRKKPFFKVSMIAWLRKGSDRRGSHVYERGVVVNVQRIRV